MPVKDPRVTAPVASYWTDGTRLVMVLQTDHDGVTVEDVASELLDEINAVDLMQRWRRVRATA